MPDGGQGGHPVGDRFHLVAALLEQAPHIGAHVGVVVGQHHARAALHRGLVGLRSLRRHGVSDPAQGFGDIGMAEHGRGRRRPAGHMLARQVRGAPGDGDAEGRALADAAFDPHCPAMQLHQLLHQGEADTSSLQGPGLGYQMPRMVQAGWTP